MVDAITRADSSDLFTEAERAAIAFSLELTRSVTVSEETFARAKRAFSERQLVDLAVNVGVANLNNRLTEAFWPEVEK
jgi:alkylhydroperoxidase family enzyme